MCLPCQGCELVWWGTAVLSVWGVQRVCAPGGVWDDLLGDRGCSAQFSSFLGEIALPYQRAFTEQLYPLLTDTSLGYKDSWASWGRMSCSTDAVAYPSMGQEVWRGMKLASLCQELHKSPVQVSECKSAALVSEFSFLIK